MSVVLRSKPHFVLGYNGCDRDTGETAINSDAPDGIQQSNQGYDWLGPGIYFWEADPVRAFEWAEKARDRQVLRHKEKGAPIDVRRPFAIGAIINLGTCLDLTTRASIELLAEGYSLYAADLEKSGERLPKNEKMADGRVLAHLDNRVIKYTCRLYEKRNKAQIDTVRAFFLEGGEVYPGSQFEKQAHVQICVRKNNAIIAYFRVHGMQFPD